MDEIRQLAQEIHHKLMKKGRENWDEKDLEIWRKLRDIVLHSSDFDVD